MCSFAQVRVEIDPRRAEFKDLVEILENDLAYTEGVSLFFNEVGIYEPDYDDNLTKPFSHFGISNGDVLTVMDEKDEDTRVILDVLILERYYFLSHCSCDSISLT